MCANALGIQLNEASLQYKDSQTPTLAGLSMTIPANQWTVLLVAQWLRKNDDPSLSSGVVRRQSRMAW